jgi:hypothetical protein
MLGEGKRHEIRQARRRARVARWQLRPGARIVLDDTVATVWRGQSIEEAEQETKAYLQNKLGIDPATILMIIQVCILIYKLLKEMGVFSTSEPMLLALLDEDTSDE